MRRLAGSVGLVLAALLVLPAGCASSSRSPAATPWTRVALPAGVRPAVLAPGAGGSLLVGVDGAEDGSRAPRVLRLRGGKVAPIPVRPASYYGRRTVWHGLVESGGRLYAFGGRSGGAHGNIRWTAWSGRSSLREDVQDFETFGGSRAGSLSALVVPGRPLIVGSRVSAGGGGLDVAVWHLDGRRWIRRPTRDRVLVAGADQQPSAQAAAVRGAGVLIAGSTTLFGEGRPRTVPAVWVTPSAGGAWRRILLPVADGSLAEAQAAACSPDGVCTVAGNADGHLVAWRVGADGGVRRLALPRVRTHAVAVTLDSTGRVVLATDARLLIGDERHWRRWTVPAGGLLGVAAVASKVWVLTGTGLWSVPVS